MLASMIFASLSAAVALAAPHPIKTHLAIDADFPDPAVTRDPHDRHYYAFATNSGGKNVQVAKSKDFKSWKLLSHVDALPEVGAWADQEQAQVWAPDVMRYGPERYIMYYSAKVDGTTVHCVGAAIATSITGPYHPQPEPLVCPVSQGGAIDAAGYWDPKDGKRYVVYKVDGNSVGHGGLCGNTVAPIVSTPIMLQHLSVDGITKLGEPKQILDRGPADGPLVEAPSLVRTKAGKYVLFFSSSCFTDEGYDIAYAMADDIAGPYVKGGPLAVTGTSGLVSPGGADVAPDGKHLAFHANLEGGKRAMFVTKLDIDVKKMTIDA